MNATLSGAPDSPAVICGVDRSVITYRELEAAVSTVARTLTGNGLRSGDVVALMAANTIEFVVGLLGASRAGMTVTPLDPALPDAVVRQRLDMLGARVLLTGPDREQPTGACPAWTLSRLAVNAGAAPRNTQPPEGSSDDDALIMLTSGTTGTPKMVPWTHSSLTAAVTTIAQTYDLSDSDATVAAMPLFHGHGLIATLLTSLSVGGSVLLPARGRFSARTFWDDMAAAGGTWFTAVPTIHQILLGRTEPGQPDEFREFDPLRFLRSCSAPLSPATATRLERTFGVPVLQAYGMTEATHHISGCTVGDDLATRLRSVGRPIGAAARIVDGEIQLAGPTIARGYLGDPALSVGVFTENWLRTGDLGILGDHGELVVTGRIKNIINRGGEKISPEHVEEVLAGYRGIAQAAVFPLPDPMYGERVAAAVVADQASSERVTAENLADYCRTRLAAYEVPDHISVIDHLPLTAKGAVDRAALVKEFA